MSCSWILLEVMARAARSGSSSSWSNFITSLQLLRDNQSWLDPTDSYNDCVKVLSKEGDLIAHLQRGKVTHLAKQDRSGAEERFLKRHRQAQFSIAMFR